MDVVAYAAQIAAQLGAHIIKVKLPSAHLEQAAAKKVYEAEQIPMKTLAERVRHVVQSSFDGAAYRDLLRRRKERRQERVRRGARYS